LQQNNGLTKNVSLAIISSGIEPNELGNILGNISIPTKDQERKLYGAYSLIVGDSLNEVLVSLNCKTAGLDSLADLLNPKKLFPNSYQSLTVPVYNTTQSVTNSKTYYPIYSGLGTNGSLNSPLVKKQIGTQISGGTPQIEVNVAQPIPVIEDIVATPSTAISSGGGGKAYDTFDNAVR